MTRGLLSLGDVDRCATVRDREAEGLADFHLRSDEWSDELHPAGVLYAAYGAHLGKDRFGGVEVLPKILVLLPDMADV